MTFWAENGSKGVGDDGDGGGGGIIFPGHPGPIPNVPRDQISRKGIPHPQIPKSRNPEIQLVRFGSFWNIFGHIWTYGDIWDLYGTIWAHTGPIWAHTGPFWTIVGQSLFYSYSYVFRNRARFVKSVCPLELPLKNKPFF